MRALSLGVVCRLSAIVVATATSGCYTALQDIDSFFANHSTAQWPGSSERPVLFGVGSGARSAPAASPAPVGGSGSSGGASGTTAAVAPAPPLDFSRPISPKKCARAQEQSDAVETDSGFRVEPGGWVNDSTFELEHGEWLELGDCVHLVDVRVMGGGIRIGRGRVTLENVRVSGATIALVVDGGHVTIHGGSYWGTVASKIGVGSVVRIESTTLQGEIGLEITSADVTMKAGWLECEPGSVTWDKGKGPSECARLDGGANVLFEEVLANSHVPLINLVNGTLTLMGGTYDSKLQKLNDVAPTTGIYVGPQAELNVIGALVGEGATIEAQGKVRRRSQ
ncbi:MAG: hypothetical protein U0271_14985 [Polyangiaceae bacterium]